MNHSVIVVDAPEDVDLAKRLVARAMRQKLEESGILKPDGPLAVAWTVEPVGRKLVEVVGHVARDPMRQTEGSTHPPGEGL